MSLYRLYFLDHQDHIVRVEELECADDREAATVARSRAGGLRMELWHKDRRIERFDVSRQ